MSRFDSEINWMTNEIMALKTQYQRKMGQLRVIEYTVPITFQLYKNPDNDRIISTKRAQISARTKGTKTAIISARVDLDDNDGRVYSMSESNYYNESTRKQSLISVLYIMVSNNQSDIDTISGGDTPSVSFNVIVSSTAELDIEVEYVNN